MPAAGEGLDPVVPAAETAEVPAVGRAAVGVGDAVVDVAATGRASAAGHAAVPVPGLGRSAAGGGRPIGVGRRGRPPGPAPSSGSASPRSSAAAVGRRARRRRRCRTPRRSSLRVATATSRPVTGSPIGDLDAAAGRCGADAQHVELLEQLAALRGGDDLAGDLGGRLGRAGLGRTEGGERCVDVESGGHRRPGRVPRPQDQVGGDLGADDTDRARVAVGAQPGRRTAGSRRRRRRPSTAAGR